MTQTDGPCPKLAGRIKNARTQAGLTQEELANRLGRTSASIALVEGAKRSVTTDLLMKIAEETSKPMLFFFEDESTAKKKEHEMAMYEKQIETFRSLLDRAEEKCRSMLEQSPDPLVVFRITDLKLDYANKRACKYFGYSLEELTGKSVADLEVDLGTVDELTESMHKLEIGELNELDGLGKRKDGTTFPVHVRLSKVNQDLCIANVRDMSKLV